MKKNLFIFVLLLIIVGLLVFYLFFRKDSTSDPQISYIYTTDTVYVNRIFEVQVHEGTTTDPITIIRYKTDSSALDSLSLILNEKELMILRLLDSIHINHYYLKQFPHNPKLLSFTLKKDTMVMGLLPISGQIEERVWPIDLNRWSYAWDFNSDLTRHPTSLPSIRNKLSANFFVGGGVDILWLSPYFNGRVELGLSRIRLYGDAQIGLLKNEAHGIKVGLDYKLNGKNINRKR